MTNRPAYLFAGGYLLLFLICAISPYDRAVWWAENIPIFLLVAVIVAVHRYHNFSTISYFLMSFLVVLRTIGGHYTFERFPFSLVTDTFGFERNQYDRMAYFSAGFYAFPIAEVLLKKRLVLSVAVLAMCASDVSRVCDIYGRGWL
jgi:putative membrane protein